MRLIKNTFVRFWPATDNKHIYVFLEHISVFRKHIEEITLSGSNEPTPTFQEKSDVFIRRSLYRAPTCHHGFYSRPRKRENKKKLLDQNFFLHSPNGWTIQLGIPINYYLPHQLGITILMVINLWECILVRQINSQLCTDQKSLYYIEELLFLKECIFC